MRDRIKAVLGREPTLEECLAITALHRLLVELPVAKQFVNQHLLDCIETTQSTH